MHALKLVGVILLVWLVFSLVLAVGIGALLRASEESLTGRRK